MRDDQHKARLRAFEAARLAIEAGMSQDRAATQCGTNRISVNEASLILKWGSPEEIADVTEGRKGMDSMVNSIRLRTTPAERRAGRRMPRQEMDRAALDAHVWHKLRSGLEAIATLPQPQDVVDICHRNMMRGEAVDRMLIQAFAWLTEFSDAWTK